MAAVTGQRMNTPALTGTIRTGVAGGIHQQTAKSTVGIRSARNRAMRINEPIGVVIQSIAGLTGFFARQQQHSAGLMYLVNRSTRIR